MGLDRYKNNTTYGQQARSTISFFCHCCMC